MPRNIDTYVAITPNDAVLLRNLDYLRIGGDGNLVLKSMNGSNPVTLAVTAGEYVPFGDGYVMAASSATGIAGFGGVK
jgi:hypothetical protein